MSLAYSPTVLLDVVKVCRFLKLIPLRVWFVLKPLNYSIPVLVHLQLHSLRFLKLLWSADKRPADVHALLVFHHLEDALVICFYEV